ncbi:hypothetical protein EKO04_009917 [Ascochyta lentis]|uniref:Uncharacterized protein n=1 Tax=Ascochyta lentis TaxID=205686 RepID=A0A8H7IYY2_9PLEO|nr:hypothetical protein EKO04_009917 [Ascochyta lentis]
MADQSQSTVAPHAGTSPPYPPRATSIPDDSETEFNPTPLHSPGGPQYEDLPPSYDFALSDARNGAAALDASQIEAHRVSANEGPNEPEVWEYRLRDEGAGADDVNEDEHEHAPAYDGHVPVQHVASSESIPVGRVGDLNAAPAAASRDVADAEDPPHSIPHAGPTSGQTWSPFGTPSRGPFGAPGNGPFGAPGVGPFGCPISQRNGGGRFDRGRGGRGARSVPAQDWQAFGRNIGKMGEEFGRRMGNWGEQFGRQAGAAGEQFGRQAAARGQELGRDSGAWAAAYSGRAAGAQNTHAAGPSNKARSEPPQYDEPPSYQGPAGVAGQETGVFHGDRKVDTYPPDKGAEASSKQLSEKRSEKTLGKQKVDDEDDSDSSSLSSDSSTSSSSSSDSEVDDYDATQAAYLKRIEAIHLAAEAASFQGKKSPSEIADERELALAAATSEKEVMELQIAQKQSRRTQKRELRARQRELTRAYRQKKMELRTAASEGDGKGKGKGKAKAKKGREWKEVKKEYKRERRALKRERGDAKREWKRERRERKVERKEGHVGGGGESKVLQEKR